MKIDKIGPIFADKIRPLIFQADDKYNCMLSGIGRLSILFAISNGYRGYQSEAGSPKCWRSMQILKLHFHFRVTDSNWRQLIFLTHRMAFCNHRMAARNIFHPLGAPLNL